ncbi:hypothetical protein U1Q18_011146, partial [Sarracenia purpurea var. burkii]
MAMEDHILHDQLNPLATLCPNYPLQTHQIPSSSSCQTPTFGTVFSGPPEKHRHAQEEEQQPEEEEEEEEELGAMKEMMYKIAAMQPVDIDPATIRRPRRRNVRISDDPQSVAARLRRERISEKIRILQRLVPGGTKMDTASMLDEAIRYVKFLKRQIRQLQSNHHHHHAVPCVGLGDVAAVSWPVSTNNGGDFAATCSVEPPGMAGYGFGACADGDRPYEANFKNE